MTWKKDKSAFVLLALSFLLIAMLLLRQTKQMDPVRAWAGSITIPVQYAFNRLVTAASHRIQALVHMQQIEAQKKELEETVGQLMLRTIELEEAKIELELLREQLGFKEANPQYTLLAAEVIGHDPTNLVRFLIIDRGARDGIAKGMPVISSRGLVGRIAEVSAQWSKVLLLVDTSSSVNAMVQRSRATGVVQGRMGGGLAMRYIPQEASVQENDIIITSGLGGNFPKGLVIGQVTAARRSDVEMFQEAKIRSAVDFNRLEVVMVILNFTPLDFASAE